jgi:hypothetical protein
MAVDSFREISLGVRFPAHDMLFDNIWGVDGFEIELSISYGLFERV